MIITEPQAASADSSLTWRDRLLIKNYLFRAGPGRSLLRGAYGCLRLAAGSLTAAHCLMQVDGAGWHRPSERLIVPSNVTLLTLPHYSPELNPVENAWQYLRSDWLNHRVWESYEEIVGACCVAWNALMAMPDRITSIATRDWAKVSV